MNQNNIDIRDIHGTTHAQIRCPSVQVRMHVSSLSFCLHLYLSPPSFSIAIYLQLRATLWLSISCSPSLSLSCSHRSSLDLLIDRPVQLHMPSRQVCTLHRRVSHQVQNSAWLLLLSSFPNQIVFTFESFLFTPNTPRQTATLALRKGQANKCMSSLIEWFMA